MSNPTDFSFVAIERARDDLRRGMPIIVESASKRWLVAAAEEWNDQLYAFFASNISEKASSLLLTPNRAKYLFQQQEATAIALSTNSKDFEQQLAYYIGTANTSKENNITSNPRSKASLTEEHILSLIKQTELLPAAVMIEITAQTPANPLLAHCLSIHEQDIIRYPTHDNMTVKPVIKVPLNLKGANKSSIISYRPSIGGHEHYAIIIGEPEKDPHPLVRLHSSCYTGDLLGSLMCDCGEQLQTALHTMGSYTENNTEESPPYSGGVILYLMQEGRGIGLTNKLRTYDKQHQGYDTVDANEMLGFEDDERTFSPAASILQDLSMPSITLLTNNPKKASQLEQYGIHVNKTQPHIMRAGDHNKNYLRTKKERLGHKL